MHKAIFLDRDGVINQDTAYLYRREDVRFCRGIFAFCEAAARCGYLLIVVTNQSGVARGYFTENDVRGLHDWMTRQFAARGIRLTAFYYCPFHAKGTIPRYAISSPCRKPEPGMILQAAEDWHIDLAQSIMIGDKPSDRIKHPALRSYILRSPYSENDYDFDSLDDLRRFLFTHPIKSQ